VHLFVQILVVTSAGADAPEQNKQHQNLNPNQNLKTTAKPESTAGPNARSNEERHAKSMDSSKKQLRRK